MFAHGKRLIFTSKPALRFNKTLSIIAVAYLLINGLFDLYAIFLKGGTSFIYVFIYPAFWIVTLIAVAALCIRNRNAWFARKMLLSTIIAIICCTPLVLLGISLLLGSSSYPSAEGYYPKNGYIIKFEQWDYDNGKPASKQYWRKRDDGRPYDSDAGFQKDSIWVYFNKNGDTLRTETYREDLLIKTKTYKK